MLDALAPRSVAGRFDKVLSPATSIAALAKSKRKIAGPDGAASKLGIPRSTLDSKIKQLKIKKYKFISKA
jgi:transcriptional regulator with GAF, ATPase, and Fis domain